MVVLYLSFSSCAILVASVPPIRPPITSENTLYATQLVLAPSEHHLEHHLVVTAGSPESRLGVCFQ